MKKRGLSAVVTTLIIILLVLVAVGVVWVVIANLIAEGTEQVSLGKFTINMEIKNVEVKDDGTVDVKVKRNPGKGELSGIKFLVSDGVEVQEFEEETTIGELGQKTFTLNYDGLVKDVSIAPILKSESGKEFVGNEIDSEEIPKKKIIENLGGVSWWRFEGDAQDEIGDNDGSLENGADCNVQGKFGKACEFDGSTEYIEIADDNSLDIIDEITISGWMYKDANPNDHHSVLSRNGESFIVNFYYSSFQAYFYTTSGTCYITIADYDSYLNAWHHFALVFDGATIFAYIDSIPLNTESCSGTINPSANSIYIGARGPSNAFFNGQIDEPIIFNKALSEDEVEALHNLDLS